MRILIFVLVAGLGFIFVPGEMEGQGHQDYIYGKVVTVSGDEYVGFMRWGKEELLWHDVFNSQKINDKHNKYYRKSEEKDGGWWDIDWKWSSIWEDKYSTTSHTFACFFGDIKAIEILRGDRVDLELKDGSMIKLDGGSNDIGTSVKLYDYELGLIMFDWKRIKRIEFSEASPRVTLPHKQMLFGTVKTRRNGAFTGYIKWDLDERVLDDVLDGDSDLGDQKIEFSRIRSITKHGSGADVELSGGKKIHLSGSNDVNSGNRGIAVYNQMIGNIEIPWKEFESVRFESNIPYGVSYESFKRPDGLRATIKTFADEVYKGRIAFDIDEMYEIEFLDGYDNGISYQIPFRNIDKIFPKNEDYSVVILNDGTELLLGNTQDVSHRNDGILVFREKQKDPHYIAWDDIGVVDIR